MKLHHNVIDLHGRTFGRWRVLSYQGGRRWLCRCDCGEEGKVFSANLLKGNSKSCGCLRSSFNTKTKTIHGMSAESEYRTWSAMKQRCHNQNAPNYGRYGGAGISVCDRWRGSFDAFFADMGQKPTPTHSIDRIDSTKGYEPGNCRWATQREQHGHKNSNRMIEAFGESKTLADWSRKTGVGATTIALRLNRGWKPEKAISTLPWTQRSA